MNNKIGYLFFVGISFNFHIYSQNREVADSLLNRLETNQQLSDSLRFELIRSLAYVHPNPQQALMYSNLALELAEQMNSEYRCARALEMIGVNNRLLGNKEVGLQSTFEALRLFDRLKMPMEQAVLHLQLGEHYTTDQNYKEAIVQFKKSIVAFDSLEDQYRKTLALLNLGEAYRLAKDLKMAEDCFLAVLKLNLIFKQDIIEAYSIGNLGMARRAQGRNKEALVDIKRAISILTELEDVASISVYTAELGSIYLEQGAHVQGERKLLEALILAKSENLKGQIRDVSKMLAEHYSDQKRYQEAFYHQEQFQIYQDSLINADNIRKLEQLKSNYEIDKKTIEIEQLALKNELTENSLEQRRIELVFTIVAILLLIVLILVIYYAYRNKQRANVALHQKNVVIRDQVEEKEMLHKEIHHRVKNNLQLIGSIMGLHSQTTNDQHVSDAMKAARSRVEAMTIIHQNLYTQDHLTHINVGAYLKKLVQNLRSTYDGQVMSISVDVVDVNILVDDSIPIGLIVNEAICNAVKYKGDTSLNIQISLSMENGSYRLTVLDNGPGLVNEKDLGTGFGTKLMSTLARQLRAELNIESTSSGTAVSLDFDCLVTDTTKIQLA